MKIVIEINMDNAAFDPDYQPELQRILMDLAERSEYLGINRSVVARDINGNNVGEMELVLNRK